MLVWVGSIAYCDRPTDIAGSKGFFLAHINVFNEKGTKNEKEYKEERWPTIQFLLQDARLRTINMYNMENYFGIFGFLVDGLGFRYSAFCHLRVWQVFRYCWAVAQRLLYACRIMCIMKLFSRGIIFEVFQSMCSWYLNLQADGRTDRRLNVT